MRKWIGNARRQSMRSPVRCHASCEVPVKALAIRFLWSARKLEHFVQRVFLCSENIGFLMYITCLLIMLQYLCKLSAELWIVLGTLYTCLYVIVYLFIYISIKHKLLLSQNFIFQNVQPMRVPFYYCEHLTHGTTCNLLWLPKPSTGVQEILLPFYTQWTEDAKCFAMKAMMRRLKHLFIYLF